MGGTDSQGGGVQNYRSYRRPGLCSISWDPYLCVGRGPEGKLMRKRQLGYICFFSPPTISSSDQLYSNLFPLWLCYLVFTYSYCWNAYNASALFFCTYMHFEKNDISMIITLVTLQLPLIYILSSWMAHVDTSNGRGDLGWLIYPSIAAIKGGSVSYHGVVDLRARNTNEFF